MALELNGTTGVSLVQDGVVTADDFASGVSPFVSFAIIADVKGNDVEGGTFTSGDFRTRDINTEISDPDGIVSISSNQFTLGAGIYYIRWKAPAYTVDTNQSLLRNITDSSNEIIGSQAFSRATTNQQQNSIGSDRITLTGSKTFEIWHRAQTTRASNGFGVKASGSGSGQDSIYTVVEIFKEA